MKAVSDDPTTNLVRDPLAQDAVWTKRRSMHRGHGCAQHSLCARLLLCSNGSLQGTVSVNPGHVAQQVQSTNSLRLGNPKNHWTPVVGCGFCNMLHVCHLWWKRWTWRTAKDISFLSHVPFALNVWSQQCTTLRCAETPMSAHLAAYGDCWLRHNGHERWSIDAVCCTT